MPKRQDDGHEWLGSATFTLPNTVVRMAHTRGIFRLRADSKVTILEVYCSKCNLGYDRAAGKRCPALDSREHLIGGPVGDQRKRRDDAPPDESHAATG